MTITGSTLGRLPYAFLCRFAAAAITFTAALAFAQSNAQPVSPSGKLLTFTIVSVKRHRDVPNGGETEGCYVDACHFVGRPLLAFIMTAYDLSQKFIVGNPLHGDGDLFDLDAKIDPADMPSKSLSSAQLAVLLQPVLADRFQLRVHHETRTLPVYNILLAKGGLKMKPSAPPGAANAGSAESTVRRCVRKSAGNGLRVEHDCTIKDVATILEGPTGRTVIDKTGLPGRYDFDLHWTPDNTPADSTLASGPSIFTAVQEQLGLKLQPSTAPLDVLVIDSAQPPEAN